MSALKVYKDWVAAITSLQVVREDEDDPSVPRPNVDTSVDTYAMIGWDSDETDGSPIEETTDEDAGSNEVKVYTSDMVEAALAVDIYGPGATDYIRALRVAIYNSTTTALLLAAGDYVIRKAGPVLTEPILRDATREPHASCVFAVAWSETVETATPAAETTVLDVTVDEE